MFELVGRTIELDDLKKKLELASGGAGRTVLVSGEAGIGKSRLIDEFWMHADSQKIKILAGGAVAEAINPFMIFSRALKNEIDRPLFRDQEFTSFAKIFAINSSGLLLAQASPGEDDDLDSDIFAGMLTAVQDFVRDSFDSSGNQNAGLGRLEYGNMTIMIEHGQGIFLTAVLRGTEHPDMNIILKKSVKDIESKHGQALENWNGSVEDMAEVQKIIMSLAESKFLVRRDLEGILLDNERVRISDTVLELLVSHSKENLLLLVLEDLHWADESSLFVLNYLARNIKDKKIMILGSMRSGESSALDRTISDMEKDASVDKLELFKLPKEDVSSLVSRMYPENNFPVDFINDLAAKCEGNAFFLLEYLRSMNEEGNILEDNGVFMLQEGDYSIPDSIEEVVHKRLGVLDPNALAIAEYASCIGREFTTEAVNSIDSHGNPETALTKLQDAGVITINNGNGKFHHAIFQELIYRDIGDRWKAIHHNNLGMHLESVYEDQFDDILYELARHFSKSRDYFRGMKYCIQAGEKAESSFAPEQAAELYVNAIDASQKAQINVQELWERLGDLYALTGEFQRSIDSYQKLIDYEDNSRTLANLNRKIADVNEKTGEFDAGVENCQKGLKFIGDQEIIETSKLLTTLGGMFMRQGKYEESRETLHNSLSIAEKLDDIGEMGRIHHIIGSSYLFQGEYDDAEESLDKAIELRGKAGDLEGQSASLNNLGNIFARTREFDKTLEIYEKAVEISKKVGNKMGTANTLTNIGSVYAGMGDMKKARPVLLESIAIEKSVGDMRGLAITLINLNITYFAEGDLESAREAIEEALDICQNYDFKYVSIYVHNAMAEIFMKMNNFDGALKHAESSMAVSKEIETIEGEALSTYTQGMVLRDMERLDESFETFTKAEEMLKELDHYMLPSVYYDFGLLWVKKEEPSKAKECFEKGRVMFKEMGDERQVKKCQVELDKLDLS